MYRVYQLQLLALIVRSFLSLIGGWYFVAAGIEVGFGLMFTVYNSGGSGNRPGEQPIGLASFTTPSNPFYIGCYS